MQDQRPLQLSLQQRAYSRPFKWAAQISINMPKIPPKAQGERPFLVSQKSSDSMRASSSVTFAIQPS
jgi:hypothetical protein